MTKNIKFKCQFLIGMVRPGEKEEHMSFESVSIPHRYGTTNCHSMYLAVILLCQFLIGMVRLVRQSGRVPWDDVVSIPHRYGTTNRKNIRRIRLWCQFLIGMVRLGSNAKLLIRSKSVNSS